MASRAVHIGLHFAQRDRTLRELAAAMEDGVLGILPTLIGEAGIGLAVVFDEAVAVPVTVSVDPIERCLRVRPERAHRLQIAGAGVVLAEQQHIQRRRVDAAVIAAERHFAQVGHLAVAHFMQNLPRLGVPLGLDRGGLGLCQEFQDALGDGGIGPQCHQRGDDAVAAERRAEPGRAGVGIRPQRRLGDQHVQIGDSAPGYFIEHRIGAGDAGRTPARIAQRVSLSDAGPGAAPQRVLR